MSKSVGEKAKAIGGRSGMMVPSWWTLVTGSGRLGHLTECRTEGSRAWSR